MNLFRRPGKDDPAPGRVSAGGIIGRGLYLLWRVSISLVALLLAGVLVLYLLLQRGPISIPGAAGWVVAEIEPELGGQRLHIGDVVLALGESGAPAGIQLRNVVVSTAEGATILDVPRLSGRFEIADLLQGQVLPIEVVMAGAAAQIVRAEDGRILFGLTSVGGVEFEDDSGGDEASETAAALIDGFAGGADLPDVLTKLRRIRIVDTRLTYLDRISGTVFSSEGARLALVRETGGARLRLEATIRREGADAGSAARVLIEGRRRAGEDESALDLSIEGARPATLAGQFAALEWLEQIDAPLDGRLSIVLADDGRLRALSGRLLAGAGQVMPEAGRALAIQHFAADVRLDEHLERIWISRADLESAPVGAKVAGFLDLVRDPTGELNSMVAQVDVTVLRLDLPEVFNRQLEFDAGRITARLVLDPLRFEIGEARLSQGALSVSVTGRARSGVEGWRTDLRVSAEQVTVEEMIAHWPLIAATNPRDWISEHVEAGMIDELVAQVRLGRGEPQVALDFRFHDATVRYLPEMPAITQGSGRGHLEDVRFALALDEAVSIPDGGGAIALDGSTFAIPDVASEVNYGEAAITASGGLADILRLIDTPPLRLLERLDADLGQPGGSAQVEASLRFPLDRNLRIDQVEAEVSATLSGLTLAPELGDLGRLEVSAERALLEADDRGMRLSGRVLVDGAALDIDWSEPFSDGGRREVALDGALTHQRLLALVPDIGDVVRSGNLPVQLTLREADGGDMSFALRVDLGPAALAVPALRWSKGAGVAGRLTAEGRIGDRLEIAGFKVAASDLSAEGALRLTPDGSFERLKIARLVLGERADIGLEVWRDAAGAIRAKADGRRLDLTEFLAEGEQGDGAGTAIRAELAIDRLLLTENLSLTAAAGEYISTASGQAQARIEGLVGGEAAVVLEYSGGTGRDDRLTVTSDNAGAVLASGGYFEGGTGGTMLLEALIAPMEGIAAQGILTVRDMRVRQAPTLSAILVSGDAADLGTEVQSGGLRFRQIEVPFTYGGGRLRLSDAIATSPSLAIKAEGIYDEASDMVDLRGVISPAYAVTGVLDRIPLLGTLLSGGEGEGIFAMTFTVGGPAAAPDFEVQPLSLLTPGILRRVFTFSGGDALPAGEFQQRIRRPNR